MRRLYRAARRAPDAERCELCAAPLPASHDHLYAPRERELRCACQGCALIVPTAEHARYRRVPRRFERVTLPPGPWLARLGVPVGLAAVRVRDDGSAVAGYPGPAGLVESELPAAEWDALRAAVPAAAALAPEVEALVCASLPGGGAWVTGIDAVFALVAELRGRRIGPGGDPAVPAALARVAARLAGGAL
ncbi:MAG TPA: DUF5947 family protein [Kofleriaceae bacterium]|nr:DUF5947 family protein [Kofleriaceae bacterium]